MSTCRVSGCVIRGVHEPDCRDHCTHRPNPCGKAKCDGHCKGCLPRPAFAPWVVCRWHGVKFGDVLDELPRFLAHLHEIGKPFAQAAPLDNDSHGTPEGFANLPGAWMAADEIMADCRSIVFCVLDDAFDVTRRRVSWPMRKPWRGNFVTWLTDHADTALCLPSAVDAIVDLLGDVERAHYRWPSAEDARPAVKVDLKCPRCDQLSLVRRPVMIEGQTERIDCTNPDCSRIYTRDEFDKFVEVALREGKMGKWETTETA